jgi:flagellar motor switch protein FliM
MNPSNPNHSLRLADEIPVPPAHDVISPGLLPARCLIMAEEACHDFTISLRKALSGYLGQEISVRLHKNEQMPFSQFVETSGNGARQLWLGVPSLPDRAILSMAPSLLSAVLALLLGANGAGSEAARADITEVELHVLDEFMEAIAREFRKAWAKRKIQFEPPFLGSVSTMRLDEKERTALVSTLMVGVAGSEHPFLCVFPSFILRLAAEQIKESDGPGGRLGPSVMDALRMASVPVEAAMSRSTVRMTDLLNIERDDVLVLRQAAGSALDCLIGGKPKFRGEMVQHGDRSAFQIQSAIPEFARSG